MNGYIVLALAIMLEICSTSLLKFSEGFTKLLPSIFFVFGMGASFYALSQALLSIPLNVAYAIWSGAGTALTAVIGVVLWKEHIDFYGIAGISLIIIGVIVLNLKANLH